MVGGCGDAPEDVAPIELDSRNGEFFGVFSSDPAPATTGENRLHIQLSKGKGKAVVGAELEIELWMAAHSHGSNAMPIVHAKGGGSYDVDHVVFPMPGHWLVGIQVSVDSVQDSFELGLDVR